MTGDEYVLSVCIPTYNNAEFLDEVLDHALKIPHDDVEFVVSDDGSTDGTEETVQAIDDSRLRYVKNDSNMGYERNLLATIERANGTYVLPLADEDKLVHESIEWVLDIARDSSREFACVIGGFGHSSWPRESWREAVPETVELAAGRESLLAFVNLPHPFAEHTWRRNYIGGFVVKRSVINLDSAAEYYGSQYIHNVFLFQAMLNGRTVLTPRDICLEHHFEYKGEHRFWGDLTWGDLEYRARIQKYRLKLIDEMLSDPITADVYRQKETRFAAQIAAWAILSSDADYSAVRAVSLDAEIRPLTDIWTSTQFKLLTVYYLLVLPLPFDRPKRNVSGRLIPQDATVVWFHLLARVLPETAKNRIRSRFNG